MSSEGKSDERFSGLSKDPRFRRPSTKKSKTVIDSRFKRILTEDRFRGAPTSNPRGMPTRTPDAKKGGKKAVNEEMQKFYELEDADAETESVHVSGDESGSDHDGAFRWDASSSSDEEDMVIHEHIHMEDGVEDELAEEDDVPLGDSTDRIAVMNCNWDHVTAMDLFALIQTFLDVNAPGRKVKRVTIHKSDFGAERMEKEEMFGPMIEGMPEDDEDDSLKTQEELKKIDGQRTAAIRKYELMKRNYYYGIVEFDSINTACIVYDELDGICGGFVSEALDLRFVPEDTVDPSEKRAPVSKADKMPVDYVPANAEVGALTMGHSKVTCSWDEDPPDRKILMKKLTPAQIADLDLEAYLESPSEDEDEVDPAELRKALFGDQGERSEDDTNEEDAGSGSDKSDDEEVVGDMEMSFSRAVESVGTDISKRLSGTGKVSKDDMSQWDKYLEKKREAKRERKLERRQKLDSQKQERIASAKAVSSAAKKARKEEDKHSSGDDEEVDTSAIANDGRLEKLFTDSKFAVDPTHPNYKKNSVVNKLKRIGRK